MRIERVVLKHHRDAPLSSTRVGNVFAVELDRTARDVFESCDTPQRRRLSAARRSDEDEELPIFDLEVEVVDCDDLFTVVTEFFAKFRDVD